MNADVAQIEKLVEPGVSAIGCELICVQWVRVEQVDTLRVYIDHPDGVDVDHCADVSRQVGAILDIEEAIRGDYNLEISSPGLDRPLVTPAHFLRFCGDKVSVKLYQAVSGKRKVKGLLVSAGDKSIVIDVAGEQLEIEYVNIKLAKLCVD